MELRRELTMNDVSDLSPLQGLSEVHIQVQAEDAPSRYRSNTFHLGRHRLKS